MATLLQPCGYTEARLAALAGEMLQDIDKNTVDFLDTLDGSLQEPSVLPARLPNPAEWGPRELLWAWQPSSRRITCEKLPPQQTT